MSGEASYADPTAYGVEGPYAGSHRLSDAADNYGALRGLGAAGDSISSVSSRLKRLLGIGGPESRTPDEATAGGATPGPSPSPTPGGPADLTATPQAFSDQERLDYAEKMRQQLSQPIATPTSTPSMKDRLMQMLGGQGTR